MADLLTIGWLVVWVALTVHAAWRLGFIENYPGEPEPSFPIFFWPLAFGWAWPVIAAAAFIVAPLIWLANRAPKDTQ